MRFEWIAAALVASTAACSREPSTAPSPSGAPPSSPSTAPPASAAPADNNRPLPEPLPEVAARVNGHEIRVKTVSSIVEPALQAGRVPHDRRSSAYRQTLDQLVMRELVLQEAQARKIAPDESAVDREYRQTRGQFKSDKEWQDFLVGAGFDDKTFREELRTRHIVDACIRQEMQKQSAVVTDDEAKAFYDQNPSMFDPGERVRASHILLRVPEAAGPDVKKAQRTKAEAALARVRKGEDFAAVAREVSEDPGSAPRGGDLGVFGRGQMVPAFEQAAYALATGQVSGLVESPFGFHIIKVQQRVAAGKVPFETVKAQIKERLAQSRREKAVGDLVQALRAKAKIENYL